MKSLAAVLCFIFGTTTYFVGRMHEAEAQDEFRPPHRVIHEYRAKCIGDKPFLKGAKRVRVSIDVSAGGGGQPDSAGDIPLEIVMPTAAQLR